MTIEHDVRLRKTINRLDTAKDAPEGVSAFPVFLPVDGLSVAQLADARRLELPAAMIKKADGSLGWLLMVYSKKTKKGSASKSSPMFYSKIEGFVSVPWLAGATDTISGEFALGGWPFPLKSFGVGGIL